MAKEEPAPRSERVRAALPMKWWPFRRSVWLTVWYLDLATLPEPIPADGITFRMARPEESHRLAGAMREPDDREPRRRFAHQRDAYIGVADEEVATYCWVSYDREWIGEIAWSLRLPPGDAYIWDCATRQTYRGRGLYPALLNFIVHDLRRRSFRHAWIATMIDNQASLRGIAKAGFGKVADVRRERRLWQRRLIVKETPNCPPELHAAIRQALALEDSCDSTGSPAGPFR